LRWLLTSSVFTIIGR